MESCKLPESISRQATLSILHKNCPETTINILKQIGMCGQSTGLKTFVIGGFVRDIFLEINNVDIDIVVEEDGKSRIPAVSRLLNILQQKLGGKITVHKKFLTGKLMMESGIEIDIATARLETYRHPGALPDVQYSDIKSDQLRRDFTINCLALSLLPSDFGALIDFFDGYSDLRKGVVRVLHDKSFLDDPTRIFRAVRFEQRFGFVIDEHTENLIREAVRGDYQSSISRQRIRNELSLLYKESNPALPLRRLDNFGILRQAYCGFTYDEAFFNETGKSLELLAGEYKDFDRDAIYLPAMLREDTDIELFIKDFNISRATAAVIREYTSNHSEIIDKLENCTADSGIYFLLRNLSPQTLVLLHAGRPNVRQAIERFVKELRHVTLSIGGAELKAAGIKKGSEIRKTLDELLKLKLDKKINNDKEEMEYICKITGGKR